MYFVTKEINWCSAHRLRKGYVGKCSNIHGHNYKAEITFNSTTLDIFDMVVDFGNIKKLVGEWIDENWDHTLLVLKDDVELIDFCKSSGSKYWVCVHNATAEYMSCFLYNLIKKFLSSNHLELFPDNKKYDIYSVKVWETDSSFAEYKEEN